MESLDLMNDAVVVRMPANPWTQTQHQTQNPYVPTASGPINVNNPNPSHMIANTTSIGDAGPWVSQSAPEIYHQARDGSVGGSRPFSSEDDEIVIRRAPWPNMLGCPETPGSTESVDSIGVVG
jgi:hypothetical protein